MKNMTGRKEEAPALQNIPLRTEGGKALREKYRQHAKPLCVNYSELEWDLYDQIRAAQRSRSV